MSQKHIPDHLPPAETRFKPGESGNPGGRPVGTRNKITRRFLNDLCADYEEHGKSAIAACRDKDPVAYVKVIAGLLPKQVEQTKPLEDMEDSEIAAGIALLRARLADRTGGGAVQTPEPTAFN